MCSGWSYHPPKGGGLSSHRRTQRYCYMYPLRRNPAPRLHYCLIAPPLSLINNCLNLPFGTQGKFWRLDEAYFLQTRNGGHRKDLYPGGPHRVLLCFTGTLANILQCIGQPPSPQQIIIQPNISTVMSLRNPTPQGQGDNRKAWVALGKPVEVTQEGRGQGTASKRRT